MLNLSIRRKTCLVSILGWIWSLHCLDTMREGNFLSKDKQTHTQRDLVWRRSVSRTPGFSRFTLAALLADLLHAEAVVAPRVQQRHQTCFQVTVACDEGLCQLQLVLQD